MRSHEKLTPLFFRLILMTLKRSLPRNIAKREYQLPRAI